MKEDAQLICPVSYEDPNEIWAKLQSILLERLPLRDVTWKSPISSSYITIDKLPLRCLVASANLFKDTDHAFRWFLAPYVNLYLLSAETLDNYKNAKSSIKKWVDLYNGPKKSPWLIVYIPYGQHTVDAYNKIYSRLCAVFYGDRSGDRSVMLLTPPRSIDDTSVCFGIRAGNNTATLTLIQQCNNSIADLLSKLREGVVVSFQHRSAMYDSDIRRLDSYRGTVQFDFRTLFLVKESLALMYQMMQLPDRALGVYEELEATLGFAPEGVLLESDWPMVSPEPLKQPPSGTLGGDAEGGTPPRSATKTATPRVRDALSDACKNGEDVVAYSINLARMKILQKKMSLLELHRYVFARQMFFLLSHLERPVACAEKALSFVQQSAAMIDKRLDERYLQSIREHENVVTETLSASGKFSNSGGPDGVSSSTSDEFAAAAEVTANLTRMFNLRRRQATLWLLTSCIKIIRVCRDLTAKILLASASPAGDGAGLSSAAISGSGIPTTGVMSYRLDYSTTVGDRGVAGALSAAVNNGNVVSADISGSHTNAFVTAEVQRASARVLSEIMQFALARLCDLIPHLLSRTGSQRTAVSLATTICLNSPFSMGETHSSEFRAALERELCTGGFDQDSISSLAAAPSHPADNNLLVSVALKIRANSTAWALEFAKTAEAGSTVFANSNTIPVVGVVETDESSMAAKRLVNEVSLTVLALKAQWELFRLADRPRFATATQLRCADIFLGCGLLERAELFIERVMHSRQLCGHSVPALWPWSGDRHSFLDHSSNLLAASTQSLNTGASQNQILSPGVTALEGRPANTSETLAAADWTETRFWLLLKMFYCAAQRKDNRRLRVIASQLLHPTFLAVSAHFPSLTSVDIHQLRVTMQKELVFSGTGEAGAEGVKGEEQKLLLHLSVYFDASIVQHAPAVHTSSTFPLLNEVRGFEVVHDEVHPVRALQCVGGRPLHIVTLKLSSSLPQRQQVERLVVVYRKFMADSILQPPSAALGSNGGSSLPSTPLMTTPVKGISVALAESSLAGTEGVESCSNGTDEFECWPCDVDGVRLVDLFIEPGSQFINLRFFPPAIGEYRLDKMTITVAGGTVVFQTNFLSDCDSGRLNGLFHVPADRVFSHVDLQTYFDKHALIRVAAPEDLLGLQAVTPAFSPLGQRDELTLQLRTAADESIEELSISAWQQQIGGATDPFHNQPSVSMQSVSGDGSTGSSFYEQQHLGLSTPGRKRNNSDKQQNQRLFALEQGALAFAINVAPCSEWSITGSGGDIQVRSKNGHSSEESVVISLIPASSCIRMGIPFIPAPVVGPGAALHGVSLDQPSAFGDSGETGHQQSSNACPTHAVASVTVTLSGRVVRHGCRILFELQANFNLAVGEALVASPTCLTSRSVSEDSDGCITTYQVLLRNSSTVPLRLLSFEASLSGGLVCLEGPTDIVALDNCAPAPAAAATVTPSVSLAPGELYVAAFVVRENHRSTGEYDCTSNSAPFSVAFHYHRMHDELLRSSAVTGTTAEPAVFSKRVEFHCPLKGALFTEARPTMMRSNVARGAVLKVSMSDEAATLPHRQQSQLVMTRTAAVGNACAFRYRLWLPVGASDDSSQKRSSVRLLGGLEVAICDTADWLVVGGRQRLLRTDDYNKDGFRVFDLEVLLSAARAGLLKLPPLLMKLGPTGESGGDGVAAVLLHPCAVTGLDTVLAVNFRQLTVRCDDYGSGGGGDPLITRFVSVEL